MNYKILVSIFAVISLLITGYIIQEQQTAVSPTKTIQSAIPSTAPQYTKAQSNSANHPTSLPTSKNAVILPAATTQMLADFETWLTSKTTTQQQQVWLDKGLTLAKLRQPVMQQLIQSDPQIALSKAVSFSQYAALPATIQHYVEQPFSEAVDLVILPNEDKNSPHDKSRSYIYRQLGQQKQPIAVYRYGKRDPILSKQNLAVQGIQLGDYAAIAEHALMPITKADVPYIQQHFPAIKPQQTVASDFYTGQPIQGEAILALAGGKVFQFASHKNLQQLNQQLARLEQKIDPKLASNILFAPLARSSNTQNSTEPLSQQLARLLAIPSNWTTSVKKVLLIRVITADATSSAISQTELQTALNNSSNLIKQISHNKTSLDATVSSQSFQLTQNAAAYASDVGTKNLLTEAKDLFSAANPSVDLSRYDIVGTHIGAGGLPVGWAGLASVGGSNYWLNDNIGLATVTHEFGHIYGLSHANFWETNNASVVGAGTDQAYGDVTDIMGGKGKNNAPEGYFHPQALAKLTWLDSTEWTDITNSGTYRVTRFDHESATGVRGLRIARNGATTDGYYWLGYRQNYDNNPYLENGAYLIWQKAGQEQSWLIDTTPASFTDQEDDKQDAGIILGQTYSDSSANMHITALAKGGTAPNEWLDIQVNLGDFSSNSAPTISLAIPTNLSARTALTFIATASDADGDNLVYQWDLGDGVIHPSSASITHTWTVGGSYTIKVTVSDMKGKTATAQQTITVSDPLVQWTARSSGISDNIVDIAANSSLAVAISNFAVLGSSDGSTWTELDKRRTSATGLGYNVYLRSIIYANNQWIAVGQDHDGSDWRGAVYTSPDATTWTERYKAGQQLHSIASSGSILVAVGDGGYAIRSSDAGVTWSPVSTGISTTLRDISYGNGQFIAVGNAYITGELAAVLTSSDGQIWANQTNNAGSGTSSGFHAIAYLNNKFIAAGFNSKLSYLENNGNIEFLSNRSDREVTSALVYGANLYFAAGVNQNDSGKDIDLLSLDGQSWTIAPNSNAVEDRNAGVFFKDTFITVGDNGSIRQSGTLTATVVIVDSDNDTIADADDNCPNTANADQADQDNDKTGDVCDTDRDGDNVVNDQDAFPDDANETVDSDQDTIGDNADNCPAVSNQDQADDDNNGTGNACETSPPTTSSIKYPFPRHATYASNTIRPTNFSQTAQDKHVSDFYDYWKQNYLVSAGTNSTNKPLYRIAFGKPNTINASTTVSEGQGYGMEVLVLMAGYDSDAQAIFNGLWRFTRQYPSGIDSRLMSWKIQNGNIAGGNDSAFDGDVDIAYGLLLADAQWGSAGEINYKAEAITVINGILASTIGASSRLPMLGDWVDDNGAKYNQYTPRSSDFMPAHFRSFGRATGDNRWNTVIVNLQTAVDTIQANSANTTGLLPDFIVGCNPMSQCQASNGQFLESGNDGFYYYNAGRDPLRIGLDALLNGDAKSTTQIKKILDWLVGATGGQASNIKAGYQLNGTVIGNYSTSFFTAPFGVAAMLDPNQQNFLNDIYSQVYNKQENYYEDSVNLLSLLVMTGNYWEAAPAVVDPNDTDGDTIANATDNCPDIANTNQANQDNDSLGDVCDTDRDGDNVANDQDAFPDDASETVDSDQDTIGDNVDNCPTVSNQDQADDDNNGTGNACEISSTPIELSGSLETYLNSIDYGSASDNTWQQPDATKISQFKQVFSDFLAGNYDTAHTNAVSLGYEVVKYTNTDVGSADIHYILRERSNATFTGGGTYVLFPTGRNAIIQSPHPKFDSNTAKQGIETYLKARPRLLMLAGTRRDNSTSKSACTDGNYFASDVAHQTQSLFYTAHQIASDRDTNTVFVQLHGFGSSSLSTLQTQCNSSNTKLINLSEGVNYATPETENSLLHILRRKVDAGGTIKACVYGNNTTSLGGTQNVEGRYSNRSDYSCTKKATVSLKRFIHLEQSYDVRATHRTDMANYIDQALTEYFSLLQTPSDSTTLLSVYHGNQGWAMDDVRALETWQTKKNAIITLFANFNPAQQTNLMSQQLPNIWNNGNIPLISWEPFLETSTTPASIEVDIAKGDYDTYLNSWINDLKVFLSGTDGTLNTADDRRIYLRLAHEMNGNWYPWSAVNADESPQNYIAMWQHIHDLFTSIGLRQDHVQWIWSVSASDHNTQTRLAEHYYPGDNYVDWLGVDGYNWGTSTTDVKWRTPTQVFSNMVNRLRLLTSKPIAINETGAQTNAGANLAEKNTWIEQLFSYIHRQNIQMLSWFNIDKETDWAIFAGAYGNTTASSGEKAYSAYQTGVQSTWILSSDSSNPRLLDQALFSGGVSTSTPTIAMSSLSAYFSKTSGSYYIDGVDNLIIADIAKATTSIKMAMYDLTNKNITQALLDAHQRGVSVEVVTDDSNISDSKYVELIQAGITVKDDQDPNALMHNKILILDEKIVWMGSANYTVYAFYRNNENLLRINHAELAKVYLAKFTALFNQNTSPVSNYIASNLEIYFSPEHDFENRLIALINTASSSINFLAFVFTNQEISDALIAAKARGVVIQGVFDQGQNDFQSASKYQTLLDAGIAVKLDVNPNKLHDKLFIIDERITVTGSYNFTNAANDSNDENSLIIHDANFSQAYVTEFNTIYNLVAPALDTDDDGIADELDPDDDNDIIPDTWESANGLNPLDSSDALSDRNGDGINNLNEYFQSLTTIWRPSPATTWQWQLSGTIDTTLDVAMYDIDLFDTPQATIDLLHSQGKKVICYFSAGSAENWRDDISQLPAAVLGSTLVGWPDEKWLDIRQIAALSPVMSARMDLAVSKKCDGIEPDNIDAYTNNTGFSLSAADQLAYNQWLAIEAHKRGLSVGLKNDLEQISELLQYFDWALNEECYRYNECNLLTPFVSASKAVFGVEYEGQITSFCPQANAAQFSWLLKNLDLDATGTACNTTVLPDSDGDGIVDVNDNCLSLANTDQADLDSDGLGDVCDSDRDGDGIENDDDIYPDDATVDSDGDGVGDSTDVYPNDPTEWADSDGDGVGDNADQFPNDATKSLDSDNDGIDDSVDNCPLNSNTNQLDSDGNGKGDVCDIAIDPNANTSQLDATMYIEDDWGTGFCADVIIRNTTSAKVDWQAQFNPQGTINNIWSALATTPDSNGLVTFQGVHYNNTLEADESTDFGYCAERKLTADTVESLTPEVPVKNEDWGSGYCATVKINNTTDHVVDWKTSFILADADQGTVISSWSAIYTVEANTIKAEGVNWNNWLLPDQFTTIGFCVNRSDNNSSADDTTAPKVTAPSALTADSALKSKALLTAFNISTLGTATASDDTDGVVSSEILSVNGDDAEFKNGKILLPSGRNLIVWYADDQAGNRGIAQQYVDVLPRANFTVNQSSSEGRTVTVEAWLNGDAPSYPVEIPFTLDSSSTADSNDYQASAMSVVIDQLQAGDKQEHPHGAVTINLIQDNDDSESTEKIVFKMDKANLKNATTGKKRRHKISILNENKPPKAKLKVSQGTKKGRKVVTGGGNVTVKAEAKDPNGDSLSYTWTSTLVDIPETPDDPSTFIFDPDTATTGRYKVRVAISDGTETIKKKKRIKISAGESIATDNTDSDGDGIVDKDEADDLNENGIPDYLEVPHDEHELPADSDGSMLSGEPGTELGLGKIAFDSDGSSCAITEEQISTYLAAQGLPLYQEETEYKADKIFDYVVESLEEPGASVQIILSLPTALTAQSAIRKYNVDTGQWSAFVEDGVNNLLESRISTDGNCPDDEETVWINGLVVGGTCLRLTIQDGGDNDADGEINGEIDDPVAITTQQSTTTTTTTNTGSTGGGTTINTGSTGGGTSTPVVVVETASNHINYFKLSINPALAIASSVTYTTRDGTAKAGQDYIATTGTATIPAGQTQVLIPVEILADTVTEVDESFSLVLSNPIGAVFPVGTTEIIVAHTIIDSKTVDSTISEGNSNHTNYFKLELGQALSENATVHYITRNGSAIAGQDYVATEGTATLVAGQTRLLIPVEIIADSITEANENFSLVLSNPTGGAFPTGTTEIVATHTIIDDD